MEVSYKVENRNIQESLQGGGNESNLILNQIFEIEQTLSDFNWILQGEGNESNLMLN